MIDQINDQGFKMAKRKIEVAALNITMHPHSPKKYLDLLKRVNSEKILKKIYGDKQGMITWIGSIDKNKHGKNGPVTGLIRRFTNLDLNGDWMNMETIDIADKNDLDDVSIPSHLKPNLASFHYVFFPKEHILFYQQYCNNDRLSSSHAVALVRAILNDEKLKEEFGVVDVTAIPDVDQLAEALRIPNLEKLVLNIKRPNPDEQDEAEREVLERMNRLNIREQTQEYKSLGGESGIVLDDGLNVLAKVAARFGLVTVKGKDVQSNPVDYKTSEHPWSKAEYFDTNTTSVLEALTAVALDVKDKLLSRFKK